MPRKLGRGSGLKINDVFWTVFLDNGGFFKTANKNYLVGADTALSIDGLTKAEVAFMDQVDADGKPIGIMPAVVLVPTALSAMGTQLYKSLEIRDITADYAVIGLWGPEARSVFAAVTDRDLSNAAFAYMTAQAFEIGGIPVLAQRVTYVGELGWEIYVPAERAVLVWDRLWAAGQGVGLRACGYKAIDALRLEKGYLALAGDITPHETPDEAGLGFCVKTGDNNPFIGREALLAARERGFSQQLCTLVIGDEEDLILYGGEAVSNGEEVVSRLRSAGYGHFVKKNIGYAYLPPELAREGTELAVEIFGEHVPARVAPRVLYDPEGKAIRG